MSEQKRIPDNENAAALQAAIGGDELFLREFFRRYNHYQELKERFKPENCDEENARQMICAANRFDSWTEFHEFKQQLRAENSGIIQFEQAADAIVNGDVSSLQKLLNQNPELIKMRSPRSHHSTLLIIWVLTVLRNTGRKRPKIPSKLLTYC